MKLHVVMAAAVATFTAGAAFAEVAPADVIWAEDGSIAESLTGAAGDPASGAEIMTTNALGNCVACHQISAMPDVPFQGDIAPTLDGAADRWSEAQLRGLVVDAKHTYEGTFMPGMYKTGPFIRPGDAYTGKAAPADLPPILNAQQVEDVVAYLLTLKE